MTNSITNALIVAAGRSSRLYPTTKELPKCLLEVSGKPIIDRALEALNEAHIEDIFVVTGFYRDKIVEHCGDAVHYIYNPFFAFCNNMGSLWMAHPLLKGKSFVYLHSDIVFDHELMRQMVDTRFKEALLLVDQSVHDKESMKVVARDGRLLRSSKDIEESKSKGEWVGIAAFSSSFSVLLFDQIEAILTRDELNVYDTAAFNELAKSGHHIELTFTNGKRCIEVDDYNDLKKARALF